MKNKGKNFEEHFKQSAKKEDLFIYRLRDNAMSYTQTDTLYSHDNMCDFFIYRNPNLFAFELKHTTYPSIGIQTNENDREKMIKYHQIKQLQKASLYDGIKAGFILSFENEDTKTESTFFIEINNFIDFLVETGKKSINMIDILRYKGVKLEQKKLRTNYHYEITKLLDCI